MRLLLLCTSLLLTAASCTRPVTLPAPSERPVQVVAGRLDALEQQQQQVDARLDQLSQDIRALRTVLAPAPAQRPARHE